MKLFQFAMTGLLTVGAIATAESLTRYSFPANSVDLSKVPPLAETLETLANTPVENREIESRFTLYNIAKLAQYPRPAEVTTAFLGTSRTKLLLPELVSWDGAVVSAGNSYNEISYSYLIEAVALREQFPNLTTIFVEASLLNRQAPPPDFIVSPDHQKYLPILEAIQPSMAGTPTGDNIALLLSQQAAQQQSQPHILTLGPWQIHYPSSQLFEQRTRLKVSTLLGLNERQRRLPITQSDIFQQLNEDGSVPLTAEDGTPTYRLEPTPIKADDPKVTRLANIESLYPWSDQYVALADWAKLNGITVVFFQPPVRSDFYVFQEKYGLERHRADMEKLSEETGFPFMDLNVRSLGYADNWSLFSDADHLGTCEGIHLYLSGVWDGLRQWKAGNNERVIQMRLPEAFGDTTALVKPICSGFL